eukprot:1363781-Amorphochlora_amoeboformis.AAC.1
MTGEGNIPPDGPGKGGKRSSRRASNQGRFLEDSLPQKMGGIQATQAPTGEKPEDFKKKPGKKPGKKPTDV